MARAREPPPNGIDKAAGIASMAEHAAAPGRAKGCGRAATLPGSRDCEEGREEEECRLPSPLFLSASRELQPETAAATASSLTLSPLTLSPLTLSPLTLSPLTLSLLTLSPLTLSARESGAEPPPLYDETLCGVPGLRASSPAALDDGQVGQKIGAAASGGVQRRDGCDDAADPALWAQHWALLPLWGHWPHLAAPEAQLAQLAWQLALEEPKRASGWLAGRALLNFVVAPSAASGLPAAKGGVPTAGGDVPWELGTRSCTGCVLMGWESMLMGTDAGSANGGEAASVARDSAFAMSASEAEGGGGK